MMTDDNKEIENIKYEESKKVFWDNYSVMKTAVDKAIMQEKTNTARRLQSMGACPLSRLQKVRV